MKEKMHAARSTFQKRALALILAQGLAVSQSAMAADGDADLKDLRAVIVGLQTRLESMEKERAAKPVATTPAAAQAEGNLLPRGLKLYGSLDSGIERVTNVGTSGATVERVPSTTGSGPSVVGFDFRGNMTDSVAAVGKAEMGIFLDTGSSGQGSRLFGRQLYVGVDTPLGSVTFGRQYSMLFFGLHGSDILGPNIYGLGSIDAYIPNARADNSVVWRGKFDKLSVGAHYSFGRDTVNGTVPASGSCAGESAIDSSACRGWSVMARYDDQKFGGAVAIDKQRGGTGAQASFFNGAAPIPIASSSDEDRRITANGYIRFGAAKLGAGWLGRKVVAGATDVSQDTYWVAAEYALTQKWTIDGSAFRVTNDDQDRDANLYAVRGLYKFDDQLATYLTVGHIDNSANAAYGVSGGGAGVAPAAGKSQLGTMAGVRYRF